MAALPSESDVKTKECDTSQSNEPDYSKIDNVILILGQCLNPDGTPNDILHQRLQLSFDLIKSKLSKKLQATL